MSNPTGPASPVPRLSPRSQKRRIDRAEAARIGSILYDTTGQSLRRSDRDKRFARYSKLAKKYSHPRGTFEYLNYDNLKYTGKSGLTPISLSSQIDRISRRRNELLIAQQRRRLMGFTTDELRRMGALTSAEDSTTPVDLNDGIHPLFSQPNWLTERTMPKHRGAVPIGGDEPGLWLAENPTVWSILKPCVQVASRLLANEKRFGWLDALFSCPRIPLPHPVAGKPALDRFEYRPSSHPQADDGSVQTRLNYLVNFISLALSAGYEDLQSGLSRGTSISYGTTCAPQLDDTTVLIYINAETLRPLLRHDLTDAEKMAARLKIACTMVHEFAHAANLVRRLDRKESVDIEPYFENEPLSELGYSFEKNLFGGRGASLLSSSLFRGGPGLPFNATCKSDFFTARNSGYNRGADNICFPAQVAPGELDPYYTFDFWAVPTSFAADLFTDARWNHIRQFGSDALKMGPLKYGTRFLDGPQSGPQPNFIINEHGVIRETTSFAGVGGDSTIIDSSSTIEEQNTVEARIRLDTRSQRILNHLQKGQEKDQSTNQNADTDLPNGYESDPELREKKVPAEPEVLLEECPRYDEFKQYFVDNRDPLRLALDTMGILPISTFYRYIRDLGEIELTYYELKVFLDETHRRKQLFICEQFPIPGAVMRVPRGWPSRNQPFTFAQQSNPPTEESMDIVDNVVSDPRLLEQIYVAYADELRDMDILEFQKILLHHCPIENIDDFQISATDFTALITGCVRRGNSYFTLGPAGIVRFIYPIDDYRRGFASKFTIALVNRFEQTAKEWESLAGNLSQLAINT